MKVKEAIPSLWVFSFEKWRYLITSSVLFVLISFFHLFLETKWIFICYCVGFSTLFLLSSLYSRSYFDEIHGRKKSIFQTMISSKNLFPHLGLYLLFFVGLGCCIVGFFHLILIISLIPWVGKLLYPLLHCLFFLSNLLELLFSICFLPLLFLLSPLAAFRLHEVKRWPYIVLHRMIKQGNGLIQSGGIAVFPVCFVFSLFALTAWKTELSFFSYPISLLSSFLLAPFLNFFFASSCFFHLHFAYLIEKKDSE